MARAIPTLRWWERALLLLTLLLVVVLRCLFIRALRVGSDEWQHLHVVWGWTAGFVQYRDYFDNHTPIFHLLYAPLLSWFGERADIMVWMRIGVLPLYFGALWFVYRLTSRLYSEKIGIWAAIFAGLYPDFLLTSTEFRADDLWVFAWLGTLTVFLTGTPFTVRRAFLGGLCLGITFMVSMKTSILLISLALAWFAASVIRSRLQPFLDCWKVRNAVFCGLAGFIVAPLSVVAFFASRNALPQFYNCVILHNAVPGLGHWGHHGFSARALIFPAALPVILWLGRQLYRSAGDPPVGMRRAIVLMTGFFFLALLESYWPLVTSQDFLPVIPLFVIVLTPSLFNWIRRIKRTPGNVARVAAVVLPAVVAFADARHATSQYQINRNAVRKFGTRLERVLRMTRPSDFVMDTKGESVFRRRPFYYALEGITKKRMQMGLIRNTIEQDMVGNGTCVFIRDRARMPEETLDWVKQYFVPLSSNVFVAGAMLNPATPAHEAAFEIVIAADYRVISAKGPVKVKLDGVAVEGRVHLAAGKHVFSAEGDNPVAVVWAQAVEAGYSPFQPWD